MKTRNVLIGVLACVILGGNAFAFVVDSTKLYMTVPSSRLCSGSCGNIALSASCAVGEVVVGGACTTSTGFSGYVTEAGAHNGNSWLCNYNSVTSGITVYAYAWCARP